MQLFWWSELQIQCLVRLYSEHFWRFCPVITIISLPWLFYNNHLWHSFCLEPRQIKSEASQSHWLEMCTWKRSLFWVAEPVKHKPRKYRIHVWIRNMNQRGQDDTQRAEMWKQKSRWPGVPHFSILRGLVFLPWVPMWEP